MLKFKLSRVGKKKQPEYRIIVIEEARDPWAVAKEIVGHYNPRTNPRTITWKEERVKHWLSMGVQATNTVYNMLVDAGFVKGDKRKSVALSKKRRAKIEAAKPKEAAPVEAPAA